MGYKRYWYLKANRKQWKDKLNPPNRNLDWGLIQDNPSYEGGVLFSGSKMIRDYFEQMRGGDVVVLHSTHQANSQYDPEKKKSKFVPAPRIVGVSVVGESLHYDKEYDDDMICISVEDMILLRKPLAIKTIDPRNNAILKKAEPFKKGTNRFALTELEKEEYEELKRHILSANKSIKEDLDDLG